MASHNLQSVFGDSEIKRSAKWAIHDYLPQVMTAVSSSDSAGLKQMLQLPFCHLDNLEQLCQDDDAVTCLMSS
jgi:hypothetical protein